MGEVVSNPWQVGRIEPSRCRYIHVHGVAFSTRFQIGTVRSLIRPRLAVVQRPVNVRHRYCRPGLSTNQDQGGFCSANSLVLPVPFWMVPHIHPFSFSQFDSSPVCSNQKSRYALLHGTVSRGESQDLRDGTSRCCPSNLQLRFVMHKELECT